MGTFRIHERIRILPGVYVNVGKTGMSLSLGGSGTTLNLSKRGTRETIGLPGTGISYTEQQPWHTTTPAPLSPRRPHWLFWLGAIIALLAFVYWLLPDHARAGSVTCSTWMEVKTCQGPGGFRSTESLDNLGRTVGQDNRGGRWTTTLDNLGREVTTTNRRGN